MKNYELTLVLAQEGAQDGSRAVLDGLASFIQERGGLLEKQDIKGKLQEGTTLAVLGFSIRQDEVENLSKKVKEEKGVLRSMIMLAPKKRAAAPTLAKPAVQRAGQTAEQEEPKMTAEDIDKKLEEIFKEQ